MSGNQEPRGVDITQEAYDQVGAGCWLLAGAECIGAHAVAVKAVSSLAALGRSF